MALTWQQLTNDDGWYNLDAQQREKVRGKFFDDFVAPHAQAAGDNVDEVRQKFHAATDADLTRRNVGMGESLQRGAGEAGWGTVGFVNKLLGVPAIAYDAAASAVSDKPTTAAQDWWFENMARPSAEQAEGIEAINPQTERQNTRAKVAGMAGTLAVDLPLMAATGGASVPETIAARAARYGLRALAEDTATHAVKSNIIPGARNAANRGEAVYEETGDALSGVGAGAADFATSTVLNAAPVSVPGNLATRAASGAVAGAAGADVQRQVRNLTSPSTMQEERSNESLVLGAISGLGMGAALGPRAPRAPLRPGADLLNGGNVREHAEADDQVIRESDINRPQSVADDPTAIAHDGYIILRGSDSAPYAVVPAAGGDIVHLRPGERIEDVIASEKAQRNALVPYDNSVTDAPGTLVGEPVVQQAGMGRAVPEPLALEGPPSMLALPPPDAAPGTIAVDSQGNARVGRNGPEIAQPPSGDIRETVRPAGVRRTDTRAQDPLPRNDVDPTPQELKALPAPPDWLYEPMAPEHLVEGAEPTPDPTHAELSGRFYAGLPDEIGWSEVGGRLLRDGDTTGDPNAGLPGEVIGRTKWVPKSDFWPAYLNWMPGKSLTQPAARKAFEKAAAGKRLGKREQEFIKFARTYADREAQRRVDDSADFADQQLVDKADDATAAREHTRDESLAIMREAIGHERDADDHAHDRLLEHEAEYLNNEASNRNDGSAEAVQEDADAGAGREAARVGAPALARGEGAADAGGPGARAETAAAGEQAPGVAPSRAEPATPGVGAERARAVIRKRFGKAVDKLVDTGKLRIVESADELPAGAQALRSEDGTLRGVHNAKTGESWIVGDSVNEKNAAAVVLHEVGGHGGLARVIGADGIRRFAAQLRTIMRTGGKAEREHVAEAERRASGEHESVRDEELLMHAVELAEQARSDGRGVSARVLRVLNDMVSAVKAGLHKAGLLGAGKLTLADMRYMAEGALRASARGKLRAREGSASEHLPSRERSDEGSGVEGDRRGERSASRGDDAGAQGGDREGEAPLDASGIEVEDIELGPEQRAANLERWLGHDAALRDESGAPLRLFRRDNNRLTSWDARRQGDSTGSHPSHLGAFFSVGEAGADAYGDHVTGGVSNIRNPKRVTMAELSRANAERGGNPLEMFDSADEARAYREKLIAEGHDGIHFTDADEVVLFEPNRTFKSDENIGTYDDNGGWMASRVNKGDADDSVNRGISAALRAMRDGKSESEAREVGRTAAAKRTEAAVDRVAAKDEASRARRVESRSAAARSMAQNKRAALGNAGYPDRGAPGWSLDRGNWNGKTVTEHLADLRGRWKANGKITLDDIREVAHNIDRSLGVRRALQDRMIAARDIRDDIEAWAGQKLDELSDTYMLENLMHGRTGARIKALEREHIEPIKAALAEEGISQAEIADYMYAQYAPTRNASIRAIDPSNDAGSGMTDADAAEILRKFKADGKLAKLQKIEAKVRAVVESTRDQLLRGGLITREVYDALKADKKWVPLRHTDDAGGVLGEASIASTGRGLDTRGQEVRRALGRHTRAENIVGEIVADAHRAIIRSEKNRVGQSLLRQALEHPNESVWKVEPVRVQKKLNEATGQVYDAVVDDMGDDRTFVVKVDGKQYKLRIEHEGLAAAMKNLGVEQIGFLTRAIRPIGRFLRALYTTYSPNFAFINPIRDATQAAMIVGADKLGAKAVARDWFKARSAVNRTLRGEEANSTIVFKDAADAKRWTEYAREFEESGGMTGYTSSLSVDEIVSRTDAEIAKMAERAVDAKSVKALRSAFEWVEHVNEANENATRLAVYANLRRGGWSKQRAASYAKDVTINFNRRGTAASSLGEWFYFFNAAVQGSHAILKNASKPRFAKMLGLLFGAQFSSALYSLSKDDDDGETQWSKLTERSKERSLVLWTGADGQHLSIPLPYGVSWISYMAGKAAELAHGAATGRKVDATSMAADALSGFANAFSPVRMENLARVLSPDAVDPVIDVILNESSIGGPVRPEQDFSDYPKPNAAQYWPGTPAWAVWSAKALNRVGGGSDVDKPVAALDVSPNDLTYLSKQYLGGIGGFGGDIWDVTVAAQARDQRKIVSKLPIVKQVFAGGDPQFPTARAYKKHAQEIARREDQLKQTLVRGEDPSEVLSKNPVELAGVGFVAGQGGKPQSVAAPGSVAGDARAIDKQLKQVRDQINNVLRDDSMSVGDKNAKLSELYGLQERMQREFNRRYNAASRAVGR